MSNHRRPRHMRRSPLTDILLLILLVVLTAALIFLIFRYLLPSGDVPDPSPSSSQPAPSQSDSTQTPPAGSSADPTDSTDPAGPTDDPESSPSQYLELPWYLILVNSTHPLPEGFSVETSQIGNTRLRFDSRAYEALRSMISGCRDAGHQPYICSAFRTHETQEQLFQNKIDRLIAQGYSKEDAPTEAGKVVAVPGTSEHELGLAVDIVDINNQNLDESQESTPVQKWLMEHCWEYGFILRYPNDKSEITGIIYEPWHYRYVGEETAKEISEQGICLEEYMEENYGELVDLS